MHLTLRSLLLVFAVFIVAACEIVPQRPLLPEERAAAERRASALLSEGRFREAAREYLRLAELEEPPASYEFRLAAATALIDEGDIGAARKLVIELPDELAPELEFRRTVLRAEMALLEQRPFETLDLLNEDIQARAPARMIPRISELRAQAFHESGQHLAAVRERAALESLLLEGEAIAENRRRLWASVSRLFPAELQAAMPDVPDTLSGWLELSIIASDLLMRPDALVREIERWRARYPGHPANPEIVPSLIELARSGAAPPTKVTLLLPLEGPFKKAAAAVRDGFLAAWYEDADNPRRPEVSVKTVRSSDVWTSYREAVASGADFVVGPLERTTVDMVASADALPVPTLALNYTSRDTRPQIAEPSGAIFGSGGVISDPVPAGPRDRPELLYQFALSPEDEARTVAERAWFDGRSRVVVITPQGDWGDRVTDAFVAEWERLGGEVLEIQRYTGDSADLSAPVKALLNIDASEARRRQVSRMIGEKVEFEARRRQDLDFLFMAAFPVQARQLRPLLEFHHAGNLPVYATSHVYAGTPDPDADMDIDGVMFPDMPWTIAPQNSSALRTRVVNAWPQSAPAYLRLYAFGADAYSLVPRLRTLKARRYIEYAGATGGLSVDRQNRVERRLQWARFDNGVPRLLTQPPSAP